MKLWGGRFSKETDTLANDFQSSIHFDQRLYREDIQGSMAHSEMLAAQGIISQADKDAIQEGLAGILADIEAGKVEFSPDNEDIHMNIEALLTQRIGEAGKRLHTARSRNDQVALDFRMYVRKEIGTVIGQLLELERVLCRRAREHQGTVMPGYTHLQRAQPISFAQHLLAYAAQFSRDVTRLEDCRKRLNECPLGSGALAGTTYPIDRERTAEALSLLARKAGIYGMIGGQAVDVMAEKNQEDTELCARTLTREQLLFIHEHKTGALIEASMMVGAILAGAAREQVTALEKCARNMGVAFQIQDDILDVVGNEAELGKPTGSDAQNQKQTYVTLHGLDQARADVESLSREAAAVLDGFEGEKDFLKQLIFSLVDRRK